MRSEWLRRQIHWLMTALLGAVPLMVMGANSVTVTVKVTVVAPPPCIINNNQPIMVLLGNVMTTRVDGDNYRTRVDYSLSCNGAPNNAMRLQIQGNGASFDGTVLQTSVDGLGVELQQGRTKRAINDWMNFTFPNKPELWAVPVKQPGVTLTGGDFFAAAIMKVDYQ
ncbi:fimbrial protein [Serratia sarumanii]|uniref:fimbrial protein n=1 Tax=Serratia sarumanii TaxID=3020826 RepID=UPI003F7F9050